jgi:toxin ParE1/3/4
VTRYPVAFRPEALQQLEDLYDFIAAASSPANAEGFTESIVSFCESLADFPFRGLSHDDLRPGLRTIGYRKRVVIAYAVLNETVAIVGIFYGGRDHERLLTTGE